MFARFICVLLAHCPIKLGQLALIFFMYIHMHIHTHPQCKLELKPLEPVYQDVRVVIPQLETSMSVEYDQFSTVGDVLHQVLSLSDPPLDPTEGYSLYHVRLRLQ